MISLLRLSTFLSLLIPLSIACDRTWARELDTRLSGFLTTGITTSNNETPIFIDQKISDDINFIADTVLGVQIDSSIDSKTRFSTQIIARDNNDHFDTNAEWLYLSRFLGAHWEIRAGRLRTPIHMLSDTIYVGVSFPWIRPPEEVYGIIGNVTRYNGFDLNYLREIFGIQSSLRLFAGEINGEFRIPGLTSSVSDINSEDTFGFEFTVNSTHNIFRLSFLNADVIIANNLVSAKSDLISIGNRYSRNSFELITEVSLRVVDSNVNGIKADNGKSVGWYGTYAYTLDKSTPYLTLAYRDSEEDPFSIRDNYSYTLGLRYDISANFSLKSEIQYSEATQDSQGLFAEIPKDNDATILSFAVNSRF